LKQNFEIFLLFLGILSWAFFAKCFGTKIKKLASISVQGYGIQIIFPAAEWFGTKFREFFVP
jgi:hypothetical protein